MKTGNGFLFDIQAKSSNELLRKMHQVKVENAKSSKESSHVNIIGGNIQKLDHHKQPLAIRNVIQTQRKKQDQLKRSLDNIVSAQQMKPIESDKGFVHRGIKRQLEVEASKKIVESMKGFCENNNLKKLKSTVDHQVEGPTKSHSSKKFDEQDKEVKQENTLKRQGKSTFGNQVKGSTESYASKKFDEQNKEVRQDNTNKRQGKSTLGNQVQCSTESHASKKIDEQTKELRQDNTLMRQGKSTTGNKVQGSTVDRQACKNKKYIPKCPALALDDYIEMRKEQHGIEEAGDEDIEENEMEDDMENDINYESDEIEGADENEVEGNVLIVLIVGMLV